ADREETGGVALGPSEVCGSVNNQSLAMLLQDLLFQNGDSGFIATAKTAQRSGIATDDANLRADRQLQIDVAYSREEVRVNGRVPNTTPAPLCHLRNLRQLFRRYVLALN